LKKEKKRDRINSKIKINESKQSLIMLKKQKYDGKGEPKKRKLREIANE